MKISSTILGLLLTLSFVAHSAEDKLTMEEFSNIYMVAGSMELTSATCSQLYPESKTTYERAYQNSFAKKVVDLFGEEKNYKRENFDKAKLLKSMGKTDEQAREWCDSEFIDSLSAIEDKYKDRFEQIKSFTVKLKEKHNKS